MKGNSQRAKLQAERHPDQLIGGAYKTPLWDISGELTIRGVTRAVPLCVRYFGQWQAPWWEDGVDKGPKTRAGFTATTTINRHHFGVSWNSALDRGGVVVGNTVEITIVPLKCLVACLPVDESQQQT